MHDQMTQRVFNMLVKVTDTFERSLFTEKVANSELMATVQMNQCQRRQRGACSMRRDEGETADRVKSE